MAIYNEFGYITIDDARIDETCNAYFKWKDLNTYISNNSHRGINMPDAISEPMGCYCMGYLWNRGDEVGDATDPNTGRKIEFPDLKEICLHLDQNVYLMIWCF